MLDLDLNLESADLLVAFSQIVLDRLFLPAQSVCNFWDGNAVVVQRDGCSDSVGG